MTSAERFLPAASDSGYRTSWCFVEGLPASNSNEGERGGVLGGDYGCIATSLDAVAARGFFESLSVDWS